jgi:hypothetical protein
MRIEITICNGLNEQRHERSREEHTQGVLESKRQLLVVSSGVLL